MCREGWWDRRPLISLILDSLSLPGYWGLSTKYPAAGPPEGTLQCTPYYYIIYTFNSSLAQYKWMHPARTSSRETPQWTWPATQPLCPATLQAAAPDPVRTGWDPVGTGWGPSSLPELFVQAGWGGMMGVATWPWGLSLWSTQASLCGADRGASRWTKQFNTNAAGLVIKPAGLG